ncbi:hypothetical protein Tsubulata_003139, partial [Turnera subulata]
MQVEGAAGRSRKEKRKEKKKMKRKAARKEMAEKAREEEERRLNDPEEQRRLQEMEQQEAERMEKDRKEFEERERQWAREMMEKKRLQEEEEAAAAAAQAEKENECKEVDDWEYVEEGPAEIIWQGNEIIVRKKKVRVPKQKNAVHPAKIEDVERPTSNPLPPQSEAFADYQQASMLSAQQLLENVAQQVPNFGTEQDKAHCPFHLKTGACRFGQRCSRVHFYPDKACTLLLKNMYHGPGLAWEQDEGLENEDNKTDLYVISVGTVVNYTDEEVERCYEEFYEDVHTEFLKYGEIVNFKVCRNGSFHMRGNVYVHYKSLDSAVQAYQSINGRYFAGKQVTCEFVNVTKWKVAICGEYMKSRFTTCSRGSACNFIHCFRNPGGDYEWADWDKPPPRYWVRKMVALFGYSDESVGGKQMEQEKRRQRLTPSKERTENSGRDSDGERHHSKSSRSSRCSSKARNRDDLGDGKSGIHDTGFTGECLHGAKEADRHHRRRKMSERQMKALEVQNDCRDDSYYLLRGDRERHRCQSRNNWKHSESELSDVEEEKANKSIKKSQGHVSENRRSHHKRNSTDSYSSRRNWSSRTRVEASSPVDSLKQNESNELRPVYSSNGRCELYDSDSRYNFGEEIDDQDRWEPQ